MYNRVLATNNILNNIMYNRVLPTNNTLNNIMYDSVLTTNNILTNIMYNSVLATNNILSNIMYKIVCWPQIMIQYYCVILHKLYFILGYYNIDIKFLLLLVMIDFYWKTCKTYKVRT
jgi:hypothetical protein